MQASEPKSDVPFNAEQFRALVEGSKQAAVDKEKAKEDADRAASKREVQVMLQEHVSSTEWAALLQQARAAASHGAVQIQLLRFPSELCSDGGRRVDIGEADWPTSLRGEAAEFYARWERELKPAGFGLTAQILDYPGGKPGNIGLFLTWGG
jgi:hypothetical protein